MQEGEEEIKGIKEREWRGRVKVGLIRSSRLSQSLETNKSDKDRQTEIDR